MAVGNSPAMAPASLSPNDVDDFCAEFHGLETSDSDTMLENPFDSEGSRLLFEAVEQMQSCGASQDIDIPQLVIVGGQSTGKSSLLQQLTDIPFPIALGCCTRFATRIVSRRTPAGSPNRFKISVVEPEVSISDFNYPVGDGKYKDYALTGEVLTATQFRNAIDEVSSEYMGITEGTGPDAKNFATQVFRIELSGPARSHFTIVDIPGRISNPKGINEHEMRGVQTMVLEYIKKPGAIVICVGDASNDVSNQEIIHLAQQHAGDRLVGVFTKCDLVSDPDQFISLATKQGYMKSHSAKDSWFVVSNRPTTATSASTTAAATETSFLSLPPWNRIPSARRGTAMLRAYLSNMLCDRIHLNFPRIHASISAHLSDAKSRLEALGQPRLTHHDRQRYLGEVVQRYAALARDAVENPGLVEEGLRVRTQVQRQKEAFAKELRERGHTYQFEDAEVDPIARLAGIMAKEQQQREQLREAKRKQAAGLASQQDGLGPVTPPLSRHVSASSPLTQDAFAADGSQPPPRKKQDRDHRAGGHGNDGAELFDFIRRQLRAFQSTQLPGLVNPQVMPALVREQTAQWEAISSRHLQAVHAQVGTTAAAILHAVCPEDQFPTMNRGLSAVLSRQWQATAVGSGEELLRHCERERGGVDGTGSITGRASGHIDATGNKNFAHELKALQTLRLLESMKVLADAEEDDDGDWSTPHQGLRTELIFNQLHCSIEDNMAKMVHDILKVYYKFTIDSFISHVTRHIIEPFLCHPNGPLKALSMEWVYSLRESEVEKLVRDDADTVRKRATEQATVARLQAALDIAIEASERARELV
ncbi:P-loop containing nucleoside triphosphate hydrolase protein [Microdochium trichocladiopsis]|uniref:P-loop containing nucleoside triphosphate hydrolase protein n=1 Tax=Microdochium trichocladiopsis TaxID=1682393 RepID=A0A9P8Y1F7_9PEZI|nr:P-loop containing nucleoside triphosphate hydrolase protein [Microdochium trichocladiopsis]KAH7028153.1 P-loop containing nucleoside triphosphate hydrolase protein [Microdochium trichocladiopsis]